MAGNTETGKPGFIISQDDVVDATLQGVYSLDVGSLNDNEPGYPDKDIAAKKGDINIDQTVKDLSNKTKVTLGNYLGKKTQTNYYKIDPSTEESSINSKAQSTDRRPQTPQLRQPPSESSEYKWFTSKLQDPQPATSLQGWLRPDSPTPPPTPTTPSPKEVVKKGKLEGADPNAKNGNELLPGVIGPLDPEKGVGKYTRSVLSYNRFTNASDSSRYVPRSNPSEGNTPTQQTQYLDAVANDKWVPVFHHPVYGDISANRLAQVGVALSLRASQELNSFDGGNNPTGPAAENSALLPGVNQTGASRVNLLQLQAADVIKTLTEKEIPESQLITIADGSWGSLNNVMDQFAGASSLGMVTLAIALSAATGVVLAGFTNLLALAYDKQEVLPPEDPAKREPYIKGVYQSKGSSTVTFAKSLFNIAPTLNPYLVAVAKGSAVFFGVDGSAEKFGKKLLNTVLSAGQVSIVARTIIRSSATVIRALSDNLSDGFSLNATAAIKSILKTVEVVTSSKVFAALNMFAMIGDAVLLAEEYDKRYGNDALKETEDKKVHFGRLPNSKKLSWASNRAPSLYHLPKNIKALSDISSMTSQVPLLMGKEENESRARYRIGETNRIPGYSDLIASGDKDTLEAIEKELDAEYMPFYFHDIRTNEVISFHAFLESIGDDYSASYDSIEGFGRVEPVKIYKGTQRKISLSFFIAALDQGDFDSMWDKINKLTTLVYPQYTEGRRLTVGDSYNFVQPFSQLIGAAPLTRIRLGNLLRSNYSRFALARLFGAGLKDVRFDSKFDIENTPNKEEFENAEQTIKDKLGSSFWLLKQGRYTTSNAGPFGSSFYDISESEYYPIELVEVYDSNPGGPVGLNDYSYYAKFVSPDRLQGYYTGLFSTPAEVKKFTAEKQTLYENVLSALKLEIKSSDLIPTAETKKKIIDLAIQNNSDLFSDTTKDYIEKLNDFLLPEKNSVVKSFESAGGKGLAGFIESMGFDWYDRVTWDISPGVKAPKMCKVSISFTPIHDISPGLDSQGYNRAPIYPVGSFGDKK
jgi:hypothetical protein